MGFSRIKLPADLATYAFVLGARGIYVLMRLVIVLGLPFVLGPAALGQFGTFSALVAILPMAVGMGVPNHVVRRLATATHPSSFRTLAFHILIGATLAMLITAAWLRIYPDVSRLTGFLVAVVAGIEVVRAAAYSLAIARSSIIRANVAYLLSVTGPSLAVLTG